MWEKKGLIFKCDKDGTGYAQDPFIDMIDDKVWRIYYSTRTKDVRFNRDDGNHISIMPHMVNQRKMRKDYF